MSRTELTDNLTFFSALQTLKRLTEKGLLSEREAKTAEADLKRKLRPTV